MRILSIDWDYFFPDSAPYDMGHNENWSPTLSMILWMNRTAFVNMLTGEALLDTYVPTVPDKFWNRVLKNQPPVLVADSHFRIWDNLLNRTYGAYVTSLDAHHDSGYGKDLGTILNCGNWAAFGKCLGYIKSLKLYYPTWRKEKDSKEPKAIIRPDSTSYGLPPAAHYDAIFICRSGTWTTPWHDDRFLAFVENSGCKITFIEELPIRMSMKEAQDQSALQRDLVNSILNKTA